MSSAIVSDENPFHVNNQTKTTYEYEEAFDASIEYFEGDDLAAKVFLDKYALRDEDQNLLEKTPEDMHRRIAREFARIEKNKFSHPMSEDEIFRYLEGFRYIVPQGSPMYGIGNDTQIVSLSNCYVINSPEDSYGGIHRADEELSQISKRRGGVGLDISKLRPEQSVTHNAARTSSGTGSFMERYSNSIREVGQNGRRGALMITMSVHHPDILTFTTIKNDLTKVTGANISVRLSNEFLNAVANNEQYEIRWPIDSDNPEISQMVDAREVWMKIIENAHAMAEPGLLFWDNILRYNPADCYAEEGFRTISTNPCVTKDTWIMTSKGPKKVEDLIGQQFEAVVDGKIFDSNDRGFYYTGRKEVFKITTSRGYTVKATGNHLLKTAEFNNRQKKISWTPVSQLNIGDNIAISNHRDFYWDGNGNFNEGWLIGSLLGDGCFEEPHAILSHSDETEYDMCEVTNDALKTSVNTRSDCKEYSKQSYSVVEKNHIDIQSSNIKEIANQFGVKDNKELSDCIEKTSSDFHRGFLRGWFDANGTVLTDNEKSSYSIRLSSIKEDNLYRAQRMLSHLGIASSIYCNRKDDDCSANHELYISKDNILIFNDIIGFSDQEKQEELDNILNRLTSVLLCIGAYKDKFVTSVISVESIGYEEVYDCTIPDVSEFDANGIAAHNCSELPLCSDDSCRLLLENLYSFVKNAFTQDAYFDFEEFFECSQVAQRMMDNMIDLELEKIDRILNKIDNDPEDEDIKVVERRLWQRIRDKCEQGRRTGTGITALGDTMAALGISYGSEESIDFTEKIYRTLKLACYRSSVNMAKELGPFPIYNAEKEKDCEFIQRIAEEDPKLYDDMTKYGRRNIALLTTAPAGSVSMQTQTTSGIEPLFMMKYKRRKKINPNDENARTDYIDINGDCWQEFMVHHPKVELWMDRTNITDLTKAPWYGCSAEDLDWQDRVRLQANATKHVDHAISSTINLPEEVTVEKVAEIYETAWQAGCKGLTVYRKNCRSGVLVEEKDNDNQLDEDGYPTKIIKTDAPKRPASLPAKVHHTTVKGDKYFVLVGMYEDEPYEVFAGQNGFIPKSVQDATVTKKKRGHYEATLDNGKTITNIAEYISDDQESVTRLVSASLRHGADLSHIVHQLEKARGDMQSFSKAVSRCLKKHVPDGSNVSGEDCPSCGEENLQRKEGCVSCLSCGWSRCG